MVWFAALIIYIHQCKVAMKAGCPIMLIFQTHSRGRMWGRLGRITGKWLLRGIWYLSRLWYFQVFTSFTATLLLLLLENARGDLLTQFLFDQMEVGTLLKSIYFNCPLSVLHLKPMVTLVDECKEWKWCSFPAAAAGGAGNPISRQEASGGGEKGGKEVVLYYIYTIYYWEVEGRLEVGGRSGDYRTLDRIWPQARSGMIFRNESTPVFQTCCH